MPLRYSIAADVLPSRQPLEYLSDEERLIQRQVAVEMINEDFTTVNRVIAGFAERIGAAKRETVL